MKRVLSFIKISLGLGLAGWLPVRLVFFTHLAPVSLFKMDIDQFLELTLASLLLFDFSIKKITSHRKKVEKSEDYFWWHLFSSFLDLVAGIPYITLAEWMGYSVGPLWLLPKFILIRHISRFKKWLEYYDSLHPILQRLFPIGLMIPTVVHLAACGWVWLGGGTSGLSEDPWENYVRALYFIMTTFTTVGYGDISPKTLLQMGYTMMVQLVGVGFFGFVVSNVASLLARMDAARETHLSALDRVESFMSHNELPHYLRVKVRSYYRYLWDTRHGYDDNVILADLPNYLRSEVALALNAESLIKVPLFAGAEKGLIEDVVLEFKSKVVVPGEKIFHVGEPGHSMYFIHKGSVEILTDKEVVLATLSPGSFFGEMALLTSNPRSAIAQSLTYCDLFELSRESFEKVLHRYPQFENHIREVALKRGGTTDSTPESVKSTG